MDLILGNMIDPEDLGFKYGFSLFETFLVNSHGSVFLLQRHMERLISSMSVLGFNMGLTAEELKSAVLRYIENKRICNRVVRVTVSFGNKNKELSPSIYINDLESSYQFTDYPIEFSLALSKTKKDPDSLLNYHKTGNYLGNYLEVISAAKNGYNDSLFLNYNNHITETTKCNIFFIKDGTIHTPSVQCGLLPGIVRSWVIETFKESNLGVIEGAYTIEDVNNAQEVFLTNSVAGIAVVRRIDNKIINMGSQGDLTLKVFEKYNSSMKME
ncbi:MAG TPA: aminotransferase class IV [Pseudobacteroides sp.]|uniref:aminotransferase class IV n=1 Tax=Pseudobacteroides sp. TaxID=1968840 RepID=UPI002F9503C5